MKANLAPFENECNAFAEPYILNYFKNTISESVKIRFKIIIKNKRYIGDKFENFK